MPVYRVDETHPNIIYSEFGKVNGVSAFYELLLANFVKHDLTNIQYTYMYVLVLTSYPPSGAYQS